MRNCLVQCFLTLYHLSHFVLQCIGLFSSRGEISIFLCVYMCPEGLSFISQTLNVTMEGLLIVKSLTWRLVEGSFQQVLNP